jgi:myo-inositol-1(or 4)-monophosphatase
MRELERRRRLCLELARDVGKVIMEGFGSIRSINKKGKREFVTNIDLEGEEMIANSILKKFPHDTILGEEREYPRGSTGFSWIIDPLDGTHNYLHNIEIFGTSIAIAYGEDVLVGVIYIPFIDELYEARKGKGAYLNGKRIKVSKRTMEEATLVYDSRFTHNKDAMFSSLAQLVDRVFNVRMFGSTARSLTYLAEGKIEVEIEFSDKIWDFAAGLLLVEEAGGVATDFEGRRWGLKTESFVASNGIFHDELIKITSRIKGEGCVREGLI